VHACAFTICETALKRAKCIERKHCVPEEMNVNTIYIKLLFSISEPQLPVVQTGTSL
jgi:hypothetical protein